MPAVQRAVVHALQLALEDLERSCSGLSQTQLYERPAGVASVGFHLRHIVGSVGRLLTYAEAGSLSDMQMAMLKAESEESQSAEELFSELRAAISKSIERVRRLSPAQLEEQRFVGRKQLPTTVGGLLVHVAEHTQRHVGQAIVTARIVKDSAKN